MFQSPSVHLPDQENAVGMIARKNTLHPVPRKVFQDRDANVSGAQKAESSPLKSKNETATFLCTPKLKVPPARKIVLNAMQKKVFTNFRSVQNIEKTPFKAKKDASAVLCTPKLTVTQNEPTEFMDVCSYEPVPEFYHDIGEELPIRQNVWAASSDEELEINRKKIVFTPIKIDHNRFLRI